MYFNSTISVPEGAEWKGEDDEKVMNRILGSLEVLL